MSLNLTVIGPEGAPPLVLSNALGTSSQMWDRQLDAFSRRFAVVLYEHAARPSVTELADSIIDALDRVGVRQFSFCGLSLGAMVGMTIAAAAPDRIDRLVLACTSARLGHETECNERIALVRSGGVDAVAPGMLESWFTPAFADREQFLRMQLDKPREEYALALTAAGRFDLRERLREIRADAGGGRRARPRDASARRRADRRPDPGRAAAGPRRRRPPGQRRASQRVQPGGARAPLGIARVPSLCHRRTGRFVTSDDL